VPEVPAVPEEPAVPEVPAVPEEPEEPDEPLPLLLAELPLEPLPLLLALLLEPELPEPELELLALDPESDLPPSLAYKGAADIPITNKMAEQTRDFLNFNMMISPKKLIP
jgi:hypothetical protein